MNAGATALFLALPGALPPFRVLLRLEPELIRGGRSDRWIKVKNRTIKLLIVSWISSVEPRRLKRWLSFGCGHCALNLSCQRV